MTETFFICKLGYKYLVGRCALRGVYTIQQTSSKLPANVFKIHMPMLDVCLIV